MRPSLLLSAIAIALLTALYYLPDDGDRSDTADATPTRVFDALGGEPDAGYRRATEVRPFVFPRDHGAHPDYRNEWWYLTGNLRSADGQRFGYQLTLFRIAMSPPAADDKASHEPGDEPGSPWRSRQLYMGHFALTDANAGSKGEHQAHERFARAAIGLAGAQSGTETEPLQVWLEDWSISALDAEPGASTNTPGSTALLPPLRIQAAAGDIAIDLRLRATKPIVLQGDRGLSQKSAALGNASYYYSSTRLASHGTLRSARGRFEVSGNSWLDREWSSSALGSDQTGWDWFALQLDDGRDLMFYRLRRTDGSSDPLSSGKLIAADGSSQPLPVDAVELQAEGDWVSPTSGDRYPAGWTLQVPSQGLKLRVTPLVAAQEMRLTVRYWEGAVEVSGEDASGPVSGHGYLEMTRYNDARTGTGTGTGTPTPHENARSAPN